MAKDISLTRAEAEAALAAIGQMTDGNARDFNEWRKQTSGTKTEWNALIRAETRLLEFVLDCCNKRLTKGSS